MVIEIHQHHDHPFAAVMDHAPTCVLMDYERMRELVVAMGWPSTEWTAYLGF